MSFIKKTIFGTFRDPWWEEMESGIIGRRLSCRRWKGRRRRGRLSATAGSPWPRSGRGEVFLISSEFLQQEIVINFKKLFPSKITSSSVRGLSPCCPIVWLGQALVDWGLEGEDFTFWFSNTLQHLSQIFHFIEHLIFSRQPGSSAHAQLACSQFRCSSFWDICSAWRKSTKRVSRMWCQQKQLRLTWLLRTWNLLMRSTIRFNWIPLMFSSFPSTLCTRKMW